MKLRSKPVFPKRKTENKEYELYYGISLAELNLFFESRGIPLDEVIFSYIWDNVGQLEYREEEPLETYAQRVKLYEKRKKDYDIWVESIGGEKEVRRAKKEEQEERIKIKEKLMEAEISKIHKKLNKIRGDV